LNSVGEEVGNGLSIERDLKTDKRRNLGVVINIAADLMLKVSRRLAVLSPARDRSRMAETRRLVRRSFSEGGRRGSVHESPVLRSRTRRHHSLGDARERAE
jgi:hypothetical protein